MSNFNVMVINLYFYYKFRQEKYCGLHVARITTHSVGADVGEIGEEEVGVEEEEVVEQVKDAVDTGGET